MCSSCRHSRRSVAVSSGLIGGLDSERTWPAHPAYHHTLRPRGHSKRQPRSIQRHEPDTQALRSIDNVRSGRVVHHELVRMKAQSDVMGSGELAARFESPNDRVAARKGGHVVATFGMSLHRQNLAIETETPYSVVGTELQRACNASAFVMHSPDSLSRATSRSIRRMALTVVLRNLIGCSRKTQHRPKRIDDSGSALFFNWLRRLKIGYKVAIRNRIALRNRTTLPSVRRQTNPDQ